MYIYLNIRKWLGKIRMQMWRPWEEVRGKWKSTKKKQSQGHCLNLCNVQEMWHINSHFHDGGGDWSGFLCSVKLLTDFVYCFLKLWLVSISRAPETNDLSGSHGLIWPMGPLDPGPILLGFVPYPKWNFTLYFHTVKCKTICMLFIFLTGVLLGLAGAITGAGKCNTPGRCCLPCAMLQQWSL